jgi:cytoskeletal protein CcmA (bactofilin family)
MPLTQVRAAGPIHRGNERTEAGGVDMTFGGFLHRDRNTGEADPQPDRTGSATRPAEPAGPTAFLDVGSEFSGVLRSRGTVRIDGHIEGEVHAGQLVIVSASARVHADLEAEAVVVSGEVRGNVTARRKITLDRTARVTGDLSTPGIVIEEGAHLKGRILIGSEDEPKPAKKPTAKSDSAPQEGEAARGARKTPRREPTAAQPPA